MELDDAKEREAEILDGATPEQMHKRVHFTKPDSDTVAYPPQSPILRPGFPGVPELVQHHMPHAPPPLPPQPAIHVIRPSGYGFMPDPRPFPTSSKPPIGYAGYTFTKNPAEHIGQKETWAIVKREKMPVSQADLESEVKESRKRGVTGLDQYMDSEMKGFKRKQIDELIRDCVRLDPDSRFEYIIASIKRDTKRRQSGPETSTMQVILKRQPRAGIDMRGPPFMMFGSIRLPSGGFVDLSEVYSSQNSSNGYRPGMYPFERHISEPWVHIDRPDMRPPIHHAHSHDGHPIFAEEVADVKNGEDLSIANRFEESAGMRTSNVHRVTDDVRSPFGDVFVGQNGAPSPVKLNAPHFSTGRALSPQVGESHNDQTDVHVIDFGQPSPRLDGSHHDHPIFDEEGHGAKEELSGVQHHEETNDLKPLSSTKNTESIDWEPVLRISRPLSRTFHHAHDESEYHYNWTDDLISLSTLSCQSSLVSAARSCSKSRYYSDSSYYSPYYSPYYSESPDYRQTSCTSRQSSLSLAARFSSESRYYPNSWYYR